MFVIIDIYSKNLSSLLVFVSFFLNEKLKPIYFTKCLSVLQKKKKKTFLTILKSPHVNKTAQEQFGSCVYKKRIKVFTLKLPLFIVLLKTIRFNLISDINFQIKVISNLSFEKRALELMVNQADFRFDHDNINLIKYIRLLESKGELILTN